MGSSAASLNYFPVVPQVCSGDLATSRVSTWVSKSYQGKLSLQVCLTYARGAARGRQQRRPLSPFTAQKHVLHSRCCLAMVESRSCSAKGACGLCLQVRSVPEDTDTAQALRLVTDDLRGQNVVVLTADLVCTVPLQVCRGCSLLLWRPSLCPTA